MNDETLPDLGCGFMAFILGLYLLRTVPHIIDMSEEGKAIVIVMSAFILIWGTHKGLLGINDIFNIVSDWVKERRMKERMKELKEITGVKE